MEQGHANELIAIYKIYLVLFVAGTMCVVPRVGASKQKDSRETALLLIVSRTL